MNNKGLRQNRFSKNPLEKRFADEWELANESSFSTSILLDHILSEDEKYLHTCTTREREVAATIIQWLGTEIGQGFLDDVNNKIEIRYK